MAEHVRIDEGLKRGARKAMRAAARTQPHSANGDFASRYSSELRAEILATLPERIRTGETTTQIAQSYGIPSSTLRSWIVGDETVEAARGLMLAQELVAKIEEIEAAGDALALGRAREGWRAWSWIAERRESRLYGQKQEVAVTHIGEEWGERLRRARERVIGSGSIKTVESAPALPVPDENDSQADV